MGLVALRLFPATECEHFHDLSDFMVSHQRVPQPHVGVNLVEVPASDLGCADVALIDEIGDDAMSRSFRDTGTLGDVAQPRLGVGRDAEKHVGMVRQERPLPNRCLVAQLSPIASGPKWTTCYRNTGSSKELPRLLGAGLPRDRPCRWSWT